VALSLESTVVSDAGDSAIRQCLCMILELAPYRRKRYFMLSGKGVYKTALLMVDRVSNLYLKYVAGQREAVRVVPR